MSYPSFTEMDAILSMKNLQAWAEYSIVNHQLCEEIFNYTENPDRVQKCFTKIYQRGGIQSVYQNVTTIKEYSPMQVDKKHLLDVELHAFMQVTK